MAKEKFFTDAELVKLGNTIIYFSNHCSDLYKTKLLKLLYLLEEASVKKYARPFLNLDFYVWRLGPISKELFVELSEEKPNLLNDFIHFSKADSELGETTMINAKKEFDDSEFSDSDLFLLETIANDFGKKSGNELIEITHNSHSLWFRLAESNGLIQDFENRRTNTSNIQINMGDLHENDSEKKALYLHSLENYEANHSIFS
ncbi:DUF4065 domain-containing protein [bacterium]|nr:MAG: DUF4065 domain-containing protein [bacterium]